MTCSRGGQKGSCPFPPPPPTSGRQHLPTFAARRCEEQDRQALETVCLGSRPIEARISQQDVLGFQKHQISSPEAESDVGHRFREFFFRVRVFFDENVEFPRFIILTRAPGLRQMHLQCNLQATFYQMDMIQAFVCTQRRIIVGDADFCRRWCIPSYVPGSTYAKTSLNRLRPPFRKFYVA